MTVLGLTSAEVQAALREYLAALDALADLLDANGDAAPSGPALVQLDGLRFTAEVDVRARATLEGQARMSAVERAVLEPALRAVHVAAVEAGAPGLRSAHRSRLLRAVEGALHAAIKRANSVAVAGSRQR